MLSGKEDGLIQSGLAYKILQYNWSILDIANEIDDVDDISMLNKEPLIQ